MGRIRAAIVGAGLMGRWHAYYAARTGVQIVAVADVNHDQARALQRKYPRATVFADLPAALAATQPDVVHICTPLTTHLPLAEVALMAGCHVLVEKPLAATQAETERLLASARLAGRQVWAVHQFPFQRGVRRVRASLSRLGELVHVTYRTCSAGGTGRSAEARRGVLLEILPHPISLFLALVGADIGRLSWRVVCFTDDDLHLHARRGNTQLSIEISLRGRPPRNELTLIGTRASAVADLFHGSSLFEPGGVGRVGKLLLPFRTSTLRLVGGASNLLGRALRREFAYPGLRELIAEFYAGLATNRASPISPAELLGVAEVLDQIRLRSV